MKYIYLLVFLFSQYFVCSQENALITSAEITFTFVSHDVSGTISGFESTSTIDLNNITDSTFKGSVAVETISTRNSIRNWALKRGKYFDADEYPKISFESTSITTKENGFLVEGQLTIKSTTRPISINFTKTAASITGTTSLNSSDYGIIIVKKERDKNKVDVKFVFNLK